MHADVEHEHSVIHVERVHVWIGVDVSKDTLDVCLLHHDGKKQHTQRTNESTQYPKLVQWVKQRTGNAPSHFYLEATGSDPTACAFFLAGAEQVVSGVNPTHIPFFTLAQRLGNKTDKANARMIARFCREEAPALWRAATAEVRLLIALVRRLDAVLALLAQEKARVAAPSQPNEVVTATQATVALPWWLWNVADGVVPLSTRTDPAYRSFFCGVCGAGVSAGHFYGIRKRQSLITTLI